MARRKSPQTKPAPPLVEQSGLLFLLITLILFLFLVPFAEHSAIGGEVLRATLTVVLIVSVAAARTNWLWLGVGVGIVAIAVSIAWVTLFINQPTAFLVGCLLDALLFIAIAIWILRRVILRHLATVDSIFGAASAYLLLGLAWAVMYWGLDRFDSDALNISQRLTTNDPSGEVSVFSQFVYFSFVTISTLGYGDITPRSQAAQLLAWTEAVIGQFFLAVLVAWLINEIPSGRKPAAEDSQAEKDAAG